MIVEELRSKQRGALKIPDLGEHFPEVAVARFQREIAILRATRHPAIVELLDFSDDAKLLGYVTPLGTTLHDYWPEARKDLSPTAQYDLAYGFMMTMAEGLGQLHKTGVVHRDLKSGNVIVMDPYGHPRPVIIDFGLAIRTDDERLSLVDGRRVANRDSAPPAAYYQHLEPTAAWDCLGLAWLYGYLLGVGAPKNNRFHWRYHPLLEEPRRERLRALLAVCADLESAPQNAEGFAAMMNRFGLGPEKAASRSMKPDFSAADDAVRDANAAEEKKRAEIAERVKISIAVLSPILEGIRAALNEAFANIGERPIRLNEFNTHPERAALPMEAHLMEAFHQYGKNPGIIFSATCGKVPNRRFNLGVYVYFQENPSAGQLPFYLSIPCAHDSGKFHKTATFHFEGDGSISDSGQGEDKKTMPPEEVVRNVVDWMTTADHWKFASS